MNWKADYHELSVTHINNRSDNYNKCKIYIHSGLTLLFKKYFK